MRHRTKIDMVTDSYQDGDTGAGKQLQAALGDRLEYRGRVGRRVADHAQYRAGGGLILERLLRLVEQTHVLDSDHRLIGEALYQSDLAWCEFTHLRPVDTKVSEYRPLLQEGHREEGPSATD